MFSENAILNLYPTGGNIMRKRLIFKISVFLMAVLGCLTGCNQKDPTETEPMVENVRLEHAWKQDEKGNTLEFGIITGSDAAGNTCWTYISGNYPAAQMEAVSEVLCTDTQYIFCEHGTLKSLAFSTGDVLWENGDFSGTGISGMEADEGKLYFCGYTGTAFLALDNNGNTLHKIDSFGAGYEWAREIRMEGDRIAVTMELGPDAKPDPDGYVFLVDPRDYSFELVNPAPAECTLSAIAGDIAQVLPMDSGIVAVLYTDGTVGIAGDNGLAAETSSWKNVVQLYYGTQEGELAACMSDGRAVSTEFDLSGWKNLKELYIAYEGIAGLTTEGNVVTAGSWQNGDPDGWTDIRRLYLDGFYPFGLKQDGSLICTDDRYYKEFVSLKNVSQLYFGHGIYAVLEDGRIVSDYYYSSERELDQLQEAVELMTIDGWLFGLSGDGRLLAQNTDGWVYNNGDYFTMEPRENSEAYPNIYLKDIRYQNIKDIAECCALLMLKYDGTVDTVNVLCNWDLSQWKNIEKIVPAAIGGFGDVRIYGVRADGSVIVAASENWLATVNLDNYLGWRVKDLYYSNAAWYTSGVVGITAEGTLVGDGDYAKTNLDVLNR